MMFKEQIWRDVGSVFMNLDEFSDIHLVNGREMAVQIDSNEMIEREKHYRNNREMHNDGIYLKELLIYVMAEEFGKLPAVGRILNLDGKAYTVTDAIDEDGIYSISLEANRMGGK